MPGHTVRLVLDDVEVEVLQEALDLYLRARPGAADHRFDYRYRAAHGILGALARPAMPPSQEAPDDDTALDRATPKAGARGED